MKNKVVSRKDNHNKNNTEWYLISSDWLRDWKMFVNNKRSNTAWGARKSTNNHVGILDPGPITNNLLLDENKIPKENMQRSKHYRGVNKEVWQQLYNTYGGGPVLRRTEVNIYAEEPQERDSDSKNDKKFQSKYCLDGENDDDSNPMVSNEFEGSQSQVQSLMMGKGKTSFNNRRRPSDTSSDKQLKRYMTGSAVLNSGKESSSSRPKSNLFMPKRMKMVRIATY